MTKKEFFRRPLLLKIKKKKKKLVNFAQTETAIKDRENKRRLKTWLTKR